MNIIEATKEAMRVGKGIIKARQNNAGYYLLPTNTTECYILIPIGFSVNYGRACPRWNPNAADILSEEWELYDTDSVIASNETDI